jgi:dipeptidyl aminopeptidase/acylaminoacyl peptidase
VAGGDSVWGVCVRGVATVAAAAFFVVAGGQVLAAPPPASAFGRIPAVVDAEISPNGRHVAILGGAADRRVISIATIDAQTMPRLDLGDVETVSLRWAGNDHVLATIAFWQKEGPKTAYRVERHITVNTQAQAVARFLDTGTNGAWYSVGQPLLTVTSEASPRAVVMDLAGLGGGGTYGIWLVDPATGKGKLLERGDDDTYAFDVDRSGEPRVRIDNDRVRFWARPKGRSQWMAAIPDGEGREKTRFLGYTEPDDGVYLQKDDKIFVRKLADGSLTPFADGGETTGLIWDMGRNTAVGTVTTAEKPTITWIDKEVGAAHGVLARAFKGQHVDFGSWSEDRTRFVARVTAPGTAPVWYLYDRPRKEVSMLAEEYPELKGAPLGATRWITYKARDGLEIPAYFTLPPGAPAAGGKLPLVVLPHGGPHARDAFDFDYMVQFLATRGYAVLQPQFRGSAGFGEKFVEAGNGEWAGKMQTDLLDGIETLADAGDIDPKRVCIAGASFGGYAALAGVALHPDHYRCAVSIAGIADLGQLLLEDGRVYGRDSDAMDGLKKQLGGATRAALEAGSPGRHAAKVRAPVLLIHGDRDTVVSVAQSERMAGALKAAGKPYELVVLEGENHYLAQSAHRTRALEAMERFLAKNLPVN